METVPFACGSTPFPLISAATISKNLLLDDEHEWWILGELGVYNGSESSETENRNRASDEDKQLSNEAEAEGGRNRQYNTTNTG